MAYQCTPATFGTPIVYGAEVLAIQAALVTNYSSNVIQAYNFNHGPITVTNASFCNVTVTYTHPGENDTINVEAWLPADNWNGRLQAQGGGGWIAGRFLLSYYGMAGAIGEGYATVSTDAGVTHDLTQTPSEWALNSPGNVNLYGLQDLASVSLNDMAVFAKDLIESYYGQRPAYSYWNGCSQGGRQGMMLAQRYPEAFDGIAASAPAINWAEFIGTGLWPDLQMWLAGKAPYLCELDAIQAEAVTACDPQDGVTDGLVSDPNNCVFDPFSVVGKSFTCTSTNSTMVVSDIAAQVANASWTGAISTTGDLLWYGPNVGTDLTGNSYGNGVGIVTTMCSNGTCSVTPYSLAQQWTTYFVEKNASFDVSKMTYEEFENSIHQGVNQFTSIVGTNDPDLREFQKRGGKIMGFHGLADGIIPTKGTENYYDRVTEIIPEVQDFYRYFPAPGVGHCFGGPGGVPTTLFDSLRAWVENGTVPEQLPTTFTDSANKTNSRFLCPYPSKTVYDESCGDSTIAECFSCI
ncbi:Tannase/feruloyl esterase [Pestalotiopsis sp. NC0098]|nr:Tannase/feruloyl esterase [Pestalotiopsis sp. NC0098]